MGSRGKSAIISHVPIRSEQLEALRNLQPAQEDPLLLLERGNLHEEQLPKAWRSTGSPSLMRLEDLVPSTQDSGGHSYFLSDCLNNGQGRVVFMKR